MYVFYLYGVADFDLHQFLWGQLTSFLLLASKQAMTLAYGQGPGGPVNSIVSTSSIY